MHFPCGSRRRGGVSRRARFFVVAGAIACGAAAPGTASAADSLGIEAVTGEVQAAISSALAPVVPQPAGAGPQAEAQTADAVVQSAEQAAARELEAADPVASELATAPAAAPIAFASTGEEAAPHAWPTPREHVVIRVRHRSPRSSRIKSSTRFVLRSSVSAGVRATARSSVTTSYGQATVSERAEATVGSSSREGARGDGDRERRSSLPPSRLPQFPLPAPQGPDMSSAGQSGGQGLLFPVVMAALAAALAILGLKLLPRLLPVPAFRKPRRISLPPWHPG